MLRRCSLPDRGEYRQAAGVAAQGLDPRLFTPLWPVKTTRRTKARTIKADATIGSQPPTFRSDLLKRAKHSGHLCTSRLLAVPNLVPHCGHVTTRASGMHGRIKLQPPTSKEKRPQPSTWAVSLS